MKNFLNIKSGIIFGLELSKLFNYLNKNNIALLAINCIDNITINSVLESARISNTIVIIQFSYSGSSFFLGNSLNVDKDSFLNSSIKGAILAASYIHEASLYYKVPVILHTDHCLKDNLNWIDSLLNYSIDYFSSYGKPLFSSHMIDLSIYNLKYNLDISCYYLNKFYKLGIFLEIELGCTGGEEDGLDNRRLSKSKLYTNPNDIIYAYNKLKKISNNFLIAASFGNTHGVYKPGNVLLCPEILLESQNLLNKNDKILNFVFHGGSGTSINIIRKCIKYGVVKINLDTDIQWNYWNGILDYYKRNKLYLKSQLGNPKGIYKPNKKFYDPRIWLNNSKKYIISYLLNMFTLLGCKNLI